VIMKGKAYRKVCGNIRIDGQMVWDATAAILGWWHVRWTWEYRRVQITSIVFVDRLWQLNLSPQPPPTGHFQLQTTPQSTMSGRGKGGKVRFYSATCLLGSSLLLTVVLPRRVSERVVPSVTARFFVTTFKVSP
jgi:hypothetical protein